MARPAHPEHNHESPRSPGRSFPDCPGCQANRSVRAREDHGLSSDPEVQAVMDALASSGAEWHGDHPCIGCAITLRDRLRDHGYDRLIAAAAISQQDTDRAGGRG